MYNCVKCNNFGDNTLLELPSVYFDIYSCDLFTVIRRRRCRSTLQQQHLCSSCILWLRNRKSSWSCRRASSQHENNACVTCSSSSDNSPAVLGITGRCVKIGLKSCEHRRSETVSSVVVTAVSQHCNIVCRTVSRVCRHCAVIAVCY